jgi:hypothetical protein
MPIMILLPTLSPANGRAFPARGRSRPDHLRLGMPMKQLIEHWREDYILRRTQLQEEGEEMLHYP